MATNQVFSYYPKIPGWVFPSCCWHWYCHLCNHTVNQTTAALSVLVPFLGAKFSAQGSQQRDEQRGRKAGLPFLPTGHTRGFIASMKLPSGKCKNHTVTGGNVHLDSSQLPLFCFNHNHSFMWAVHYPCGEGVAICFTELLNLARPSDQPRAEHRTRNE